MFEIVEAIHKALRIESTWAFVLVIALGTGGIGGVVAWIVDKGYKNSAEYKQSHQPPITPIPPAPQTAIPSESNKPQSVPPAKKGIAVGKDSVVVGNIPDGSKIGDSSVVVGPTDANGNTILNKGGMAIGKGAKADATSIAIGENANAGGGEKVTPPPKQ